MRKHFLEKVFGILLVYCIVIITIFIIQFKANSTILKNVGGMKITLTQMEDESHTITLKNQMQLSFGALIFEFDEKTPVLADETPLVLKEYEQGENEAIFLFEDGTQVGFTVGENDENDLTIFAIPVDENQTIVLPFEIASSYTESEKTQKKILLESKAGKFVFSAPNFEDKHIVLTSSANSAQYMREIPRKAFEFSDTMLVENQNAEHYATELENYRFKIISIFQEKAKSAPDAITELETAAFVAEQSLQKNFNQAIDQVPSSFKRNVKRTYFTSPYFGNLSAKNATLVNRNEQLSSLVKTAINEQKLSVFEENDIVDYILREKKTENIKNLLALPKKMRNFSPTPLQAAGILNVYNRLYNEDNDLSSTLNETIEICLKRLEEIFLYEDEKLSLNVENLSASEKTKIALSLIDYGTIRNKAEIANTGYLLANDSLPVVDENDLWELYPLLVKDNKYYPHSQVLGYYGEKPVWVWTCAQNITYKIAERGVVNMQIDFPRDYSHYLIVTGVPTFHSQIEIQQIRFRSAADFENYNSSGYVYDEALQTLFLKSKHKTQIELIRMFCDPATNFTGTDDKLDAVQQQVEDLGISDVTVIKSDIGLTLSIENIQFEAESATLRPSETAKLEKIASILGLYPENDIMVAGHTAKSSIGRDPMELSKERAETVADYLANQGVRTREHIFTEGYGDTRPVASNNTEAERAKNRRVEITILNK